MCITKLDILDTLAEIKVGVSYKSKGKKINYFPSNTAKLGSVEVCATLPMWCVCVQYPCVMVYVCNCCQVEYVTLPGWQTSIEGVRDYEKLPQNAKKYIEMIEQKVQVPGMYACVPVRFLAVKCFFFLWMWVVPCFKPVLEAAYDRFVYFCCVWDLKLWKAFDMLQWSGLV